MLQKFATQNQIVAFIGKGKNISLNIDRSVLEIVSLSRASVFDPVCCSLRRFEFKKTQGIDVQTGEFSKKYREVVGYGSQFENAGFRFEIGQ
jgi:hypothetical protein